MKLYFFARQIALPGDLDWDAGQTGFIDAARAAIEGLTGASYERVFTDFERVDQLCHPIGQRALQSVVGGDHMLLERIRSADSRESRGLIVLLENETAFDRALAVSYADRQRNGRSWSAFRIPLPAAASAHVEKIEALEADASVAFTKLDGTGRRLKIESFQHPSYGRDGKLIGTSFHYSLYAEGLPESHLEFEGNEPKRQTRRPVQEGAISYDPGQKALEIFAGGGKPVREKLAQSFAQHILGLVAEVQPLPLRLFNLDRLKRRLPFPTDPVDGIKSVRVALLRLRDMA
ncbi:MAG: hypothetical protein JO069_17390, partial [Verrucomicrobia bacterium]|nr:hypothetical protein [Verrucomicrobiota bacterium]